MKKVILIVGAVVLVVVVIIAAIIGFVFWLTGDAVDSGEEFLALLAEGRTEEAYLSTATALQSQQDPSSFAAAVEQMGLTRYASASWSNRQIENNQATLEGSIETTDGGTIPLTLGLVKENDQWKVLSIQGPVAGAAPTSPPTRQIPPDEALRRLASGTLADFHQALDSGDFSGFHGKISALWKGQISSQQLQAAFQPLVAQQVDLTGIESVDPVFTEPPSLDEDGILILTGYSPLQPQRVQFTLKYFYEHPAWKLFGIHVATPGDESAAVTTSESVADEPDSTDEETAPVPGSPGAFQMVPNTELQGRLGRLLVTFPENSKVSGNRIAVYPAGSDQESTSSYGGIAADLLPGSFDVVVSGQRIAGVPIESRQDTHIKVGVLRVTAGSGTRVAVLSASESGGEPAEIASGYGAVEFGLPIGDYRVQIAGQSAPVTVTEGAIVDF